MKIKIEHDGPESRPYSPSTSHGGIIWAHSNFMSLEEIEQFGEFLVDFAKNTRLIEGQHND